MDLSRKNIKKVAVDMLGNKCFYCGESYPLCVYDFHHVQKKVVEISRIMSTLNRMTLNSFINLIDEMKKCVLLCSNCHRQVESGLIEINESPVYDLSILKRTFCNDCPICGNIKLVNYVTCSVKCSHMNLRRVKWPLKEELKELIEHNTYTSIGLLFGVSDSTVKKWAKNYGIFVPKYKRKK